LDLLDSISAFEILEFRTFLWVFAPEKRHSFTPFSSKFMVTGSRSRAIRASMTS
jgi:hypothetical protein